MNFVYADDIYQYLVLEIKTEKFVKYKNIQAHIPLTIRVVTS